MKNLWIKGALSVLLAAVFMALPEKALPITYSFCDRFTTNTTSIAGQLFLKVTDAGVDGGGNNLVRFEIINALGGTPSSIANVYFDDGVLINSSTIDIEDSPTAVDFGTGGTPADPPGAPGSWSTDFRFAAVNPKPTRGVNPGEEVGFLFHLASGDDFNDVITEIENGDLRVAIHVISIPIGDDLTTSDTYANCTTPVPEPGTLILLGSGLLASGGIARLRRKK